MLTKIKDFVAKMKSKRAQRKELDKMKSFYHNLRCGALFLEYIDKDIERQKKTMNRAKKRRYEVALKTEGKFSTEMLTEYKEHVEKIQQYIDTELTKFVK
jgi:hypothetical protein